MTRPHERLSTQELLRKMEMSIYDEDGWKQYAKILVRESGLKPGERIKLVGTVVHQRWSSAVTRSHRRFENGREVRSWGGGYEYEKETIESAKEVLVMEHSHGVLLRAEIAATTKAKSLRAGERIAMTATVGGLLWDHNPLYAKLDKHWAQVLLHDCRVDRKKTGGLRAQDMVKDLALRGMMKGHGMCVDQLARRGRLRGVPVTAAILWAIRKGDLHLKYKCDNTRDLDPRRREGSGIGVECVRNATQRVVNTRAWRRLFELAKGPAPKGDFTNPWTAEESVQGLAKRGDWVTNQDERMKREGANLVDVSSLGLHVGTGVSVWNFWIDGSKWDQQPAWYLDMCIRFDSVFVEDYPSVEVDIEMNEVRFFMGSERLAYLTYTGATEAAVKEKACEMFRSRVSEKVASIIAGSAWRRGKRALQEKFKSAGLLHLVGQLEETAA